MELSDLKPNPKNPRKITDKKLKALKKALEEFGDLGGIVFNKRTQRLVGGHMRVEAFKSMNPRALLFTKDEKTNSAHGFVEMNEELFAYREVDWPEEREMAANIAANKGAGEWDHDGLVEMLHDLDAANFDLGLTMHSESEIESLMGLKEAPKKDKDKSGKKREIACPECDCKFEI